MPTPFESAQLNLQLFDLRREALLREARQWFLMEFNPETFAELVMIVSGPRNSAFRMVSAIRGRRKKLKLQASVLRLAPLCRADSSQQDQNPRGRGTV